MTLNNITQLSKSEIIFNKKSNKKFVYMKGNDELLLLQKS